MPREYLFEFTERAEVAYGRLPKAVQVRIDEVLQRIQRIGLRRPYVAKIRGHERIYLARASNDIRIIFQVEGDTMTILDIVSRDKIQRLSRLYDWGTGV